MKLKAKGISEVEREMSNLQPLVSFQNVSFLDSVDIQNINGTLFRFIFTHSLTLARKAFQCLIQ